MNKLSIQKLLTNYATHSCCDFSLSHHDKVLVCTSETEINGSLYEFTAGETTFTLQSSVATPIHDLESIAIACKHLLDDQDESMNMDYFLNKLIQHTIQPHEVTTVAKYLCTDEAKMCLVMMSYNGELQSLLETIRNSFENPILVTTYKSKLLILFASNDSHHELCENLYHTITSELLIKTNLYHISPSSLIELHSSLTTLQTIEELSHITCPNRTVVSTKDLGIANLLTLLDKEVAMHLLSEFSTGSFEDLDNEEDIKTIYAFLENNLNIAETSRQLFIHRNTLVYRLDKYQKLTNLDIRHFEDATKFQLSFYIYQFYKK